VLMTITRRESDGALQSLPSTAQSFGPVWGGFVLDVQNSSLPPIFLVFAFAYLSLAHKRQSDLEML
jgi:hypothetical protein